MSQQVDISKIDVNFATVSAEREDAVFYDVRREPFEIYGLYGARTEPVFKRLPDEIGLNTNEGIKGLYLHTAGGRVRFSTDSDYVIIRAFMSKTTEFGHMTRLGVRGFDLYVDGEGGSSYYNSFIPPQNIDGGFEAIIVFKDKAKRNLTVNFPLYNRLEALYVGLQKDAFVGGGARYANELPVVFYGSSITQGGCASRPGNCYQNIISRRLNMDYTNLGFSGNGRAEDIIVDYMAKLPMSVFVSDYDHNAPNVDYLRATHYKMYEKIRAANPDLPYIMISRPDFYKPDSKGLADSVARRAVIEESYRRAVENGDENVYYIDGETFFAGELMDCCTVDTCHPNDLGFSRMAKVIGDLLEKIGICR